MVHRSQCIDVGCDAGKHPVYHIEYYMLIVVLFFVWVIFMTQIYASIDRRKP